MNRKRGRAATRREKFDSPNFAEITESRRKKSSANLGGKIVDFFCKDST
jgi:hypothetical protein